jgi:glutamine amidotransferase
VIKVIDYKIGNLLSCYKAFKKLTSKVEIANEPADLKGATAVVVPGVGAFGPTIAALKELGFYQKLDELITAEIAYLGICVGMQILFEGSDESPGIAGLKVFDQKLLRLKNVKKIPQMQWNQVKIENQGSQLFKNVNSPWFYFVHSYAAYGINQSYVSSCCNYGDWLASSIEQSNIFGVQFHPEKSGECGLEVLKNFLTLIS